MSFTGIFWLGQNVNVSGDKAMVVNLNALLHPKLQKINAKTSLTETVDSPVQMKIMSLQQKLLLAEIQNID